MADITIELPALSSSGRNPHLWVFAWAVVRSTLACLAALCMAGFVACSDASREPAPTEQPTPIAATVPPADQNAFSIEVLSPTEGEEVSGVITLRAAVEGTQLLPAPPSGLPGEGGHWHVLIDGQPYPEPFSASTGSIGTLQAGSHTIQVALFLNLNDSVEVASDEVTITVSNE
jgi:hypothetical protein